jgi:tRNA pseudouridine38-40 synthase
MAHRYFVKLSYDGTPFHGWQIQKNAKSIQQCLNEALSTILRTEIYTIGCGRTDTGVHARKFFAHFDTELDISTTADLMFRANCILPKEIAISKIFKVKPDVHSRFTATSRTYEYLISSAKNPFCQHRSYEYREVLDLDLMNQAASRLKNHKDFTSFSKLHSDAETNICDLHHAFWEVETGGLRFEIKANRFLRNMVRAVVGTLIELGRGKITLDQFEKIIEAKDRGQAGYSVPAHGLYLIDISYPAESEVR